MMMMISELRTSLAIWDHTVLLATRHKWTRPVNMQPNTVHTMHVVATWLDPSRHSSSSTPSQHGPHCRWLVNLVIPIQCQLLSINGLCVGSWSSHLLREQTKINNPGYWQLNQSWWLNSFDQECDRVDVARHGMYSTSLDVWPKSELRRRIGLQQYCVIVDRDQLMATFDTGKVHYPSTILVWNPIRQFDRSSSMLSNPRLLWPLLCFWSRTCEANRNIRVSFGVNTTNI